MTDCTTCKGKGFDTVQSTRGEMATDDIPCPDCNGTGKEPELCQDCGGSGMITNGAGEPDDCPRCGLSGIEPTPPSQETQDESLEDKLFQRKRTF